MVALRLADAGPCSLLAPRLARRLGVRDAPGLPAGQHFLASSEDKDPCIRMSGQWRCGKRRAEIRVGRQPGRCARSLSLPDVLAAPRDGAWAWALSVGAPRRFRPAQLHEAMLQACHGVLRGDAAGIGRVPTHGGGASWRRALSGKWTWPSRRQAKSGCVLLCGEGRLLRLL